MYSVKLEKSGRVLLPAEIRKRLSLVPGEDVLISAEEGAVTVVGTRATVLSRLREDLRQRIGPLEGDRLLSDELIADRRAEAEREKHES